MADGPHTRKDASLIETKALPASAGSVSTSAFDLGTGVQDMVAACDLKIELPELTTTELPDTETMVASVETSADDSSYVTLYADVITQTGSGSAGDSAADATVPLRGAINDTAGNLRRYVRVTVTGSTSIGDCSGKSVTASLVF